MSRFYYDAATGRWILEDKTEETRSRNDSVAEQKRAKDSFDKPIGQTSMQQISSTKQSPKKFQLILKFFDIRRGRDTMTLDQIEEHGLVLAIQAAHHASRLQQQNITSFSSSSGFYLATVKGLRDNDQEEAGLDGRLYPSVPFGAPRERKSGSKSLTRSRSLPIHRDDTESSDGEDNFVHFEEKPSAELFLVGKYDEKP